MDAVPYLRGRMDAWLTSAGTTDPIEFAFSRHELRGAARALQEAGLLTAEDTRTLLDEYDARLGEAGHPQPASAFMGASTSARAGGEDPPPARSREPGRLERMITVPQPSDATPVGDALVGLLLEVWTDMVAFHYRSERVASRHHGRGGPRWEASDDHDNVYTPRGSGGFSSRVGTRGVVEFAGRLPAQATRFVVRATNADGETTSVLIDL
jgi:hypothetical protein